MEANKHYSRYLVALGEIQALMRRPYRLFKSMTQLRSELMQ